jgi:hypothetical protein
MDREQFTGLGSNALRGVWRLSSHPHAPRSPTFQKFKECFGCFEHDNDPFLDQNSVGHQTVRMMLPCPRVFDEPNQGKILRVFPTALIYDISCPNTPQHLRVHLLGGIQQQIRMGSGNSELDRSVMSFL